MPGDRCIVCGNTRQKDKSVSLNRFPRRAQTRAMARGSGARKRRPQGFPQVVKQAFSRWRCYEGSTAKSGEATCFTQEAMDLGDQKLEKLQEYLALSTPPPVHFVRS